MEISRLNSQARVSILHIYPQSPLLESSEHISTMEEVKAQMNHLAMSLTDDADQVIDNVVLSGNVADKMLQFIHENDFDLVIVGINSNGKNNEIGSRTARVIKESDVPGHDRTKYAPAWNYCKLRRSIATTAVRHAMRPSPLRRITFAAMAARPYTSCWISVTSEYIMRRLLKQTPPSLS